MAQINVESTWRGLFITASNEELSGQERLQDQLASVVPLLPQSLPVWPCPRPNFHSWEKLRLVFSRRVQNTQNLRPKSAYMQRMRRRQSLSCSPSNPKELQYIPVQASAC